MNSIDRIRDALNHISPDDRDTWLKMAFAIKSELGDTPDSRELWDSWGQGSDTYNARDARDVWRSANGHGSITIGTLFYHAKQEGWVDHGDYKPLTPAELAERYQVSKEQAARDAVELQNTREETRRKAKAILCKVTKASDDHPYLVRKGIKAIGNLAEIDATQAISILGYQPRGKNGDLKGRLLVAKVHQSDGKISTLELIDEEGRKTALKGRGTKSGGYWPSTMPMPETLGLGSVLLIGEGVATVCSTFQITGYHAVACLSSHNFKNVMDTMRAMYPLATFVVLADIDKETGKADAKLQKLVKGFAGAVLAVPDFGQGRTHEQTDFNDLHQAKGADEVLTQIEAALEDYRETSPNLLREPEPIAEEIRTFWGLHAVVMVEGRACVVYREIDDNTGRHVTRYSRVEDLAVKFKPLKIPDGNRSKSLVPMWLESPERITYQQMTFKPIPWLVADSLDLPRTKSLNLYQGLAFKPKQGTCDLIQDHIYEVWCNRSVVAYDYVMSWLARMFQRPDERGHTVILLRSGEGTGKNIIIDMLVQAFGEHALVAVKPDDLVGKFNDALATSVLVFANEAVWGGDKTLEGALKSLITDEELPVERKYLPKYRVKNCVHLLMASNNDWAAPIGLDDRRFVVLDVNEDRKGDAGYFAALAEEIRDGGREAFIHALLTRDIAGFNPRVLPEIEEHQASKFDAKIRGADSVTQWWVGCLFEGSIMVASVETVPGFSSTVVPVRKELAEGWESGPVQIGTDPLYQAYSAWCKASGKRIEHNTTFGKKLCELSTVKRVRTGPRGGTRPWAYGLPNLDTCRRFFETKTRQRCPWIEENNDQYDETSINQMID